MDQTKLFSAVVLVGVFMGICYAVPQTRINSFNIGDFDYFGDTTEVRSREDALNYCREQGGELAKVWNRDIYNRLRNFAKTRGRYWIDGIDRPDEFRFDFTRICPHRGEFLDFRGIPAENLDLPQVSCLSFVRGSSFRNTRIEAANCNDERFVVCQAPLNGCEEQ